MPAPASQPSVLLLERTVPDTHAAPGTEVLPPRPPADGTSVGAPTGPVSAVPSFRAPGYAALAAVSVLEGYRWFGVITNSASRPWAVVFGVVAVVGGLALTRSGKGTPRSLVQRLVASAAIAVGLATTVVLGSGRGWAEAATGIAYLALALASLVALVSGERSRRRDDVAA